MCIRFDRDLNTRAIQLLEHPGRFIGMSTKAKRKFVIARALVTDPPVAFAAEWFGSTAAESATEPQLHFAEFDLVGFLSFAGRFCRFYRSLSVAFSQTEQRGICDLLRFLITQSNCTVPHGISLFSIHMGSASAVYRLTLRQHPSCSKLHSTLQWRRIR